MISVSNVTVSFGSWNLLDGISFHISDILNRTRTTRHITTENYVEDSMYNQLGRHFFITFKWNFGKLNAAKSNKARSAAMNMMY